MHDFYFNFNCLCSIQKASINNDSESVEDISVGKYGILKMIQSSKDYIPNRIFVDVKNLITTLADKSVWIRGRLHTSRAKGNYV